MRVLKDWVQSQHQVRVHEWRDGSVFVQNKPSIHILCVCVYARETEREREREKARESAPQRARARGVSVSVHVRAVLVM